MSDILPPTVLDKRYKKFCDRYLETNKKAQSAIDAGYSRKTAAVQASRLLKRPDIQAYLAHRVAELALKSEEAEQAASENLDKRIITELEAMAFANIADFIRIDDEGKPQVDFSSATPEQLKAITSIKSKTSRKYNGKGEHIATDQESSFVLADKFRGLELLGKHRGLFKTEEQRVVLDVADRLLSARKRLAERELRDEGTLTLGGGGG